MLIKMFEIVVRIVVAIAVIGEFTGPRVHASVISGNELAFQQQIARDLERNSDIGIYGFKGVIREVIPSTPVKECIFMTSESGRFSVEAIDGIVKVCGIYVFTEPNEIVEFSFPHMNVPCGGQDIIGVVDGWELNGQYFPSEVDHPLPLQNRSSEFCGSKNRNIFLSSQNIGLVQYRIPTVGKGFVLSIKFRQIDQPCNVVASSSTEPFTLRNYGRRVNCTFMAIYPAVVSTIALDVGSKRMRGSMSPETETGTIHQCDKRGAKDEVQIGGTAGLDTSQLETLDTICGVDSKPSAAPKIIDCEVTSVRLVSSGIYDNSVTIIARPTEGKEVQNADLTCGLNAVITLQ